MRECDKAAVFGAAIERLVTDAVDRAKPREPGAYAAKVRADLNDRLRPVARAMFAAHDDVTADELATMLGAHETASKASGSKLENRPADFKSTTSALPTYSAEPWRPVPPEVRRQAKERLAAIRNQLKERAS